MFAEIEEGGVGGGAGSVGATEVVSYFKIMSDGSNNGKARLELGGFFMTVLVDHWNDRGVLPEHEGRAG